MTKNEKINENDKIIHINVNDNTNDNNNIKQELDYINKEIINQEKSKLLAQINIHHEKYIEKMNAC